MGGASQGNQGISFGARRQITSQGPSVPSLAEKQKVRQQKEEEEERARQQAAEERERRTRQVQEEEERSRMEEEQKWEEETKRNREEERHRLDQQKREWEEQERRWQEEEEARKREDAALQAQMKFKKPPEKPRVPSSSILRGQTLAEYQKEQSALASVTDGSSEATETPEQRRVRELEKQLEEAKERERQYQAEREERTRKGPQSQDGSRPSTAELGRPGSAQQSDTSWTGDERDYLRNQRPTAQTTTPLRASQPQVSAARPLPQPSEPQIQPPKPLPEVAAVSTPPTLASRGQPSPFSKPSPFSRPLPTPVKQEEPAAFEPQQRAANRTDEFLSSNQAPASSGPRISSAQEAGDTSLEQQRLRDARMASQQETKAGGWASKSLLEREMERERERQKEWEANQQDVKSATRDTQQGTGEGQTWDVNQYGYMGGDSMNRGSSVGSGINIGGRRQIIGPRELKK